MRSCVLKYKTESYSQILRPLFSTRDRPARFVLVTAVLLPSPRLGVQCQRPNIHFPYHLVKDIKYGKVALVGCFIVAWGSICDFFPSSQSPSLEDKREWCWTDSAAKTRHSTAFRRQWTCLGLLKAYDTSFRLIRNTFAMISENTVYQRWEQAMILLEGT